MKCALPGCGRECTPEQVHSWKLRKKKRRNMAGPFCCKECYVDHRKTKR